MNEELEALLGNEETSQCTDLEMSSLTLRGDGTHSSLSQRTIIGKQIVLFKLLRNYIR